MRLVNQVIHFIIIINIVLSHDEDHDLYQPHKVNNEALRERILSVVIYISIFINITGAIIILLNRHWAPLKIISWKPFIIQSLGFLLIVIGGANAIGLVFVSPENSWLASNCHRVSIPACFAGAAFTVVLTCLKLLRLQHIYIGKSTKDYPFMRNLVVACIPVLLVCLDYLFNYSRKSNFVNGSCVPDTFMGHPTILFGILPYFSILMMYMYVLLYRLYPFRGNIDGYKLIATQIILNSVLSMLFGRAATELTVDIQLYGKEEVLAHGLPFYVRFQFLIILLLGQIVYHFPYFLYVVYQCIVKDPDYVALFTFGYDSFPTAEELSKASLEENLKYSAYLEVFREQCSDQNCQELLAFYQECMERSKMDLTLNWNAVQVKTLDMLQKYISEKAISPINISQRRKQKLLHATNLTDPDFFKCAQKEVLQLLEDNVQRVVGDSKRYQELKDRVQLLTNLRSTKESSPQIGSVHMPLNRRNSVIPSPAADGSQNNGLTPPARLTISISWLEKNYPDMDQKALAVAYRMVQSDGIIIKDRWFHCKKYKNCFVGSEAVNWMMVQLGISSRKMAVNLGQTLLDHGLIGHVCDSEQFEDCYFFYEFRVCFWNESAAVRSAIKLPILSEVREEEREGERENVQIRSEPELAPSLDVLSTSDLSHSSSEETKEQNHPFGVPQ